jgi:hypothetical protein
VKYLVKTLNAICGSAFGRIAKRMAASDSFLQAFWRLWPSFFDATHRFGDIQG